MSRRVRMKFTFVGTRGIGGPEWPPYNGILETTEEEAEKLVAAQWAVYLEDEPEPEHKGFAPLRPFSDNYEPALDPDLQPRQSDELTEYEADEQAEEEARVKRPNTNGKKEAWIAYALSIDETASEEVLNRMSRVDIISKYGASL